MKLATTKQFREIARQVVGEMNVAHSYTDGADKGIGDKRYVKLLTWSRLPNIVAQKIEFSLFAMYGVTANTRCNRSGVVGTCVLEK